MVDSFIFSHSLGQVATSSHRRMHYFLPCLQQVPTTTSNVADGYLWFADTSSYVLSFGRLVPICYHILIWRLLFSFNYFLFDCVIGSVSVWLLSFMGHYIWLFMNDLTQKQFIRNETMTRKKISIGKAVKKMMSIMLRQPPAPPPVPTPPYTPYCYLPPGCYVGSVWIVCLENIVLLNAVGVCKEYVQKFFRCSTILLSYYYI